MRRITENKIFLLILGIITGLVIYGFLEWTTPSYTFPIPVKAVKQLRDDEVLSVSIFQKENGDWVYYEDTLTKDSLPDPLMQVKNSRRTSLLSYEELQQMHKVINMVTKRYQVEIYEDLICSHFKGEYINIIFSKEHTDVNIRYADGCVLFMCIDKNGKYQVIHSSGEHEHGFDKRIIEILNK